MGYFSFKEALTATQTELENTELSITHVDNDIINLSNIKAGITTQVFNPAKNAMDEYLYKRRAWLNERELEQTPDNEFVYEWRSQLSHTYGFGSLCAVEVYGVHTDRSSNISDWTLERCQKYKYDGSRSSSSDYWYLSAGMTGEIEQFSNISEGTISEVGLADKYTPASLTKYADDYKTCMQWVHATPMFEYEGETWHHQAASFGIDYRISNNVIAISALDYLKTHLQNLVELNSRY